MSSNSCSPIERQLRQAIAPLRGIVAALKPGDLPLSWAPGVLDALIEAERVVVAGRLLVTARAAEAGRWEREGFASPAEWLAKQQGSSAGRAKADLGTSQRLGELPFTAGQVRDGNLSAEQAEVVTDAATVNPDAERELVETAKRESLKHTREQAARRKAEAEAELEKSERERRVRKRRSVRCWTKGDEWFLRANGPIIEGRRIEAEINRRITEIFRERREAEEREGRDAYAFDALRDTVLNGGSASAGEARKRVSPRQLMLIRVDLQSLINGFVGPGEVCEVGGHPISVEAARGLLGESVVSLITSNGEAVIDVVNLSRKPSVAQQLALLWTDPKCVVEGCNRTVAIEIDHRLDFAQTRHTTLCELEAPCSHHHDQKTFEGWGLVPGTGRRPMVPPDHPLHPDNVGRASPPGNEAGQLFEDTG